MMERSFQSVTRSVRSNPEPINNADKNVGGAYSRWLYISQYIG